MSNMQGQVDAIDEQDAPKPRKRKLFARPKCRVGRHGFHQYELVKRTKLYFTWKCRLCDRVVKQPTKEDGT